MEAAAAAFGRPRPVVKVEKLTGDGVGDGDSPSKQQLLVKMGNNCGKQEHESEDKTSCSSDQKDLSCTKIQEYELESARAEMGEVREENQRLKTSLSQMMKDYEALRMQFIDIVEQEANKLPKKADDKSNNEKHDEGGDRNQTAETELVSLTLGRFPTADKNKNAADKKSLDHNNRNPNGREIISDEDEGVKESLSLGLNCKFERESTITKETDSSIRSLANSFDHEAKEEAGDMSCPQSKGAKTMRSGNDDDVALQNPPKRARVCVRARCETATMNDGCQWRKYGQKIAKGNPCPRAYYRCTGSPTCPVRKQVQRCVDDMSVLITTYEGTHNHQLPVSATAMASTTSAAAAMLLSGSSSSTTTAANLKPNFYLPSNSSIIPPISQANPTITLDLTSNPSNSAAHFGKFPTSSTFANSRYPFTSHLDFGSSRNNMQSWNNDFFSYNNRNNNPTTTANNIYQSYFQQQRNNHNLNHLNNVASTTTSLPHQHQPLPDTIAAATKAITADPSFQSALAAALTSIIGTGGGGGNVNKSSTTRGEPSLFQLTSTATSKGNGCGTSFLSNIAAMTGTGTGTRSNSTTVENTVFVSGSSLPFSNPKSASASPGDHIDLPN